VPRPPHVKRWFSGGELQVLTTPCNEGEGADPCLARHLASVAAFMEAFPEDPR